MKNVLYSKTLVPAKDSPDGESPTIIYVTEEVNGWAVLVDSFETGTQLLRWENWRRDKMIEFAVGYTLEQFKSLVFD